VKAVDGVQIVGEMKRKKEKEEIEGKWKLR